MPIQKFADGTRVMLAEQVEAFPLATIFAPGLTGTVTSYAVADDAYWVKLDQHFPVLAEWDNELQIYGDEHDWPADRYLSPIVGTDILRKSDNSLDHYVQAMCAINRVEIDGDLWGVVFSGEADEIEEPRARSLMCSLLKLAVHDKAHKGESDDQLEHDTSPDAMRAEITRLQAENTRLHAIIAKVCSAVSEA